MNRHSNRTLMCFAALALAGQAVNAMPLAEAGPEPTSESVEPADNYFELLGVVRDFPPESGHPDFKVNPSATPGARSAKNIALMLDADKKPVYVGGGRRINQEWRDAAGNKISWCAPAAPGDNTGSFSSSDNGGITNATTFAQWFRDVPGVNMSRAWSIRLERQSNGVFEYDVSDFHPVDNQLLGNGPDEHNFYFTYEIDCTFVAQPGQFVTFTGDDDCWIFVNNRLVIDHGGIVANRRQHFTFDRLGLTAGQTYELKFFFAERQQPQSQFRLETNVGLHSYNEVAVSVSCD